MTSGVSLVEMVSLCLACAATIVAASEDCSEEESYRFLAKVMKK